MSGGPWWSDLVGSTFVRMLCLVSDGFVSVTSSAGAWRLVSVEWLVSVVVLAAQ